MSLENRDQGGGQLSQGVGTERKRKQAVVPTVMYAG